ncbi:hypothetical protein ATANTOWER_004409, partial [Ataeniobius toweri]|nr:hypothetical protein [Ataeniobius toweri]
MSDAHLKTTIRHVHQVELHYLCDTEPGGAEEGFVHEIGSAQVSVSEVIPAMVALLRLPSRRCQSDSCVLTAKSTLPATVRTLFDDEQAHYATATILDPQFKDHYSDRKMKEGGSNQLLNTINDMTSRVKDDGQHREASKRELPPKKKARTGALLGMYDKLIKENSRLHH